MTKVNGRTAKLVVIVAALLAVLAIAGCGGSSWSSAQKAKARSELSSVFGSYLSGSHVTATVKDELSKVENCLLDNFEKRFSPGSQPSDAQVTKIIDDACGSEVKALEKDVKAEVKSEAGSS